MPRPQGDNDVRLRKVLGGDLDTPQWPDGFAVRTFRASDARPLHDLLELAFDDGLNGPFDVWWPRLADDAEFDPGLCFLVHETGGRLAGAAQCWAGGFVKDLAVHPDFRGKGIAEALMRQVFVAFSARGASYVDLKTNRFGNAAAYRLYLRLGMVEVDWSGD